MKRALLISKDPIFAWAIDKLVASLNYHLEHVFSLEEARLRISRFHYEIFFLDGLKMKELELLALMCSPDSSVFVFQDYSEFPPRMNDVFARQKHSFLLRKEGGPATIVSLLKDLGKTE